MNDSEVWKGSGVDTVCMVGTGLMLAPALMSLTLGVLSRTIAAVLHETVWFGWADWVVMQGAFIFYFGASLWFAKAIHGAVHRVWRRAIAAAQRDRAYAYLAQVLQEREMQ